MSARNIRYFALAYGIVFLLVGIAGFVPGLVTAPQPAADVALEEGFGRLFGLFPVNVLHNVVHLAFGVWGLAAYRTFSAARLYAQGVAVIYAILVLVLWRIAPGVLKLEPADRAAIAGPLTLIAAVTAKSAPAFRNLELVIIKGMG